MVVLDISLEARMNARLVGSGDQDTVVLAHGYGADQSLWDKILAHLTDHHQSHRVLLFDWSFSSAMTNKDPNAFDPVKYSSCEAFAEDLIDLLDEMKLSSCVFVGHSMSAMIGCLASIKRPELFKKLVLIGASPCYLNSEDYEGGFDRPQIEQIITNIESNFPTWASAFASSVVDPSDPVSVEKFTKSLSGMRPQVALSVAKTIFYSDHRDALEKVQVPCTIVQTTDDAVAPTSVAYYMQKKMVKAVPLAVEIVEGDGHFPHLSQTKLLLEILDRVLITTTSGGHHTVLEA